MPAEATMKIILEDATPGTPSQGPARAPAGAPQVTPAQAPTWSPTGAPPRAAPPPLPAAPPPAARAGAAQSMLAVGQLLQATGLPGSSVASAGLSAAALGGAGGIAAALAVPIMATIKMAYDRAVQQLQIDFKREANIAGMNAWGQIGDIAAQQRQVPLIGGLLAAHTEGMMSVLTGFQSTAERLAAYNPDLARELAMQNVARLQRDIDRAQRFGGDISGVISQKFELEQKLQDFIDKNLPRIMRAVEYYLDRLEEMIGPPLGSLESILEKAGFDLSRFGEDTARHWREMLGGVTRVAENTERASILTDARASVAAMVPDLTLEDDRRASIREELAGAGRVVEVP